MNRPAQVLRGRAPDELVFIDADGRAVLLRGDGVTPDERRPRRPRPLQEAVHESWDLEVVVPAPAPRRAPRRR